MAGNGDEATRARLARHATAIRQLKRETGSDASGLSLRSRVLLLERDLRDIKAEKDRLRRQRWEVWLALIVATISLLFGALPAILRAAFQAGLGR